MIIKNIQNLVTLQKAFEKKGKNLVETDLSIIKNAALVTEKNKIKWVGPESELPSKYKKTKSINAKQGTIIPGFVDSHTHLVFAGDRSLDFERRLQGWTYSQIAAEGGGILTTMKATRKISAQELFTLSKKRLQNALSQGVTTLEIKTGYGLDFASEKKCLDVIAKLKKTSKATIKATFLAAHAVPPEFKNRKSDYVKEIAEKWLPKLKSKTDFIDMFLDEGYFDTKDADVLFTAAQKNKIPIKLHADELKLSGGSETAVKYKALSADHLLRITDAETSLLANSDITATLLPTTALFLKESFAPARKLLDTGARVALASDFNPGTSPTQDISLVAMLAATQMNMKPFEILAALTLNGAFALGVQNSKGVLQNGHDADFILLKSSSLSSFFYEFGQRALDLEIFVQGSPLKKS